MTAHSEQNASNDFASAAARAPTSTAKRVLIVGLDGATFDVLGPLMEEGKLPNLKAVVDSGASGILRSTTPPITPAAWTTFLTGKQPGSHGIIDFERYDAFTNKLEFNSTRCLDHVRNLWQILGDHGLKVGSVNVPMTYPPIPVNGFMVTGFETPGTHTEFAYPPSLKPEILSRWPDPTLRSKWRRKLLGGDKLFAENLDYMSRSFHQGADMTTYLGDKMGWDVLMVVFKLVDNLQHKTWKYIDKRWAHRNPKRCEMVKQCFQQADKALGTLLEYAKAHDAAVMIVSDHGHGSLEGKIQPNELLRQWGYLSLRDGAAQGATRGRYIWDRLRGRTRKFARTGDVSHDLALDFSHTKACVMHAGMAGFLYINLKGRQPTGIVNESDYESLRDELRARLLGDECRVCDPYGKSISLFSEVHKPEELYGCTREQQPWLPDLILTPHDSLAVVRKIRGAKPIHWLPFRKIEGTHRSDGIVLVSGDGISHLKDLRVQIADCAPTVLAMLGLPIPDDMEGRVMEQVFTSPPILRTEKASPNADTTQARGDVFSDADIEKVTERLADLGYLE